jgi:hypothetical protein
LQRVAATLQQRGFMLQMLLHGVECASAHLPNATLQQRTLRQRLQPLGGGF